MAPSMVDKNLTDEDLMLKYQGGGYEAFQEIYSRYSGMIYGYIKKRVKNDAIASDIFQEVFMKLHKSKNLYKKEHPFKPWLFTITQNALIDEIRKNKNKNFAELDLDSITATEVSSHNLKDLGPLLTHLPPSQKIAVEMRYMEEKTFQDIALALNTSEANVRQIVSRAIRNLKELIVKGKFL